MDRSLEGTNKNPIFLGRLHIMLQMYGGWTWCWRLNMWLSRGRKIWLFGQNFLFESWLLSWLEEYLLLGHMTYSEEVRAQKKNWVRVKEEASESGFITSGLLQKKKLQKKSYLCFHFYVIWLRSAFNPSLLIASCSLVLTHAHTHADPHTLIFFRGWSYKAAGGRACLRSRRWPWATGFRSVQFPWNLTILECKSCAQGPQTSSASKTGWMVPSASAFPPACSSSCSEAHRWSWDWDLERPRDSADRLLLDRILLRLDWRPHLGWVSISTRTSIFVPSLWCRQKNPNVIIY